MAEHKAANRLMLVDYVIDKSGGAVLDTVIYRGEITHFIKKSELTNICGFLRDDPRLSFNFLSDLLVVDYHPATTRFEVIYHLYSIPHRHRLRLKVKISEDESVPSVSYLWRSANWAEREAYDMFGVAFEKHPDLRRIYMPGDWAGYPLRKDYPLKGYRDQYNPFGEEPE